MSVQAEQGIICMAIRNNSRMQNCDLEAYEFESWQNQEIYRVVQSLVNAGKVADLITVCEELEQSCPGQEFLPYIKQLVDDSWSINSFEQCCEIVRGDYRKLQAMEIANDLKRGLESGDQSTAVDTAIQQLMSLNTVGRNFDHDMAGVMAAGIRMVDEAMDSQGLIGVDTGLPDLNECLGGFHKTDLIVVGARPAMGKTALMLNLALAAKKSVGIISAEQGHEQMGLRLISIEGSLDSQKLRTGGFYDEEWDTLKKAVNRLQVKSIRVNDEPGISISKIIRQARDWKFKYGIEALYVDYLQKIRATDKRMKKHEQVGEVAGLLKNLARELEIPVIALAQVNRDCEKRPNKRPMNSDLADASEIEKEADEILFLYRDEVYNADSQDKGIAEIDISKNRHGPTGMVRCAFIGKFMQFKELAPKAYQEMYGGAA
ncbi:hypothetical protein O4H29_06970 [Marinobacter salarius]|uniref:replicative DNA helicase n=1 Tax=Marinobacter salarius TaxID=1420917 RepID=UPI0022B09D6A|nr:DnaB-like helicase C-terminal domain-containing protein [Marinobacter salarius]MCZ4284575.1 hypothetical protein [Marinobacter salarius]